jgi:hypothetical protein
MSQEALVYAPKQTLQAYGYKDLEDAARKVAAWWRGEASMVGTINDSTPVIQQALWQVGKGARTSIICPPLCIWGSRL